MRNRFFVSLLTCAITLGHPTWAQQSIQPNTARGLALSCTACHGVAATHAPTGFASLTGQSKENLIKQMQDFKQGRRGGTVMQQIIKGYRDEEIEAIAGYFATQPTSH